ncbi:PKD-like domain-containing protein [uncultured Duncaniella sp.]|nr:PKD-like domain-containing protein [uncultured Duncaniella sp.]
MKKFLLIMPLLAILLSCNKDEAIFQEASPVIELDSEDGYYIVKVGATLRVSPAYKNVDEATFTWECEGSIISDKPQLEYIFEIPGTYYINLTVRTSAGKAEEDIRVDVDEMAPPVISIAIPDGGLNVIAGREYEIVPDVQNADDAVFVWAIDGKTVSEEKSCKFRESSVGKYNLKLTVTNDDGKAEKTITINVVDRMPIDIVLPSSMFFSEDIKKYVSEGESICLRPYLSVSENVTCQWSLDGVEIPDATSVLYDFKPDRVGEYTLSFTAKYSSVLSKHDISRNISSTGSDEASIDIPVVCCKESAMRPYTSACSRYACKVYEYVPAPGQFINEKASGYDGVTTHESACRYALGRLNKEQSVSLGAWGGYIIVGFDHSIENRGGYDFSIKGNAIDTSNEPGIVWVMQDVNGNGLPDDEWYELKGSEYGKEETLQQYAVTYFRPGANMNTQWVDNLGGTGVIRRISSQHPQAFYYPLWIESDSYTLYGTRLKARTEISSVTGLWCNNPFGWGYADNLGEDVTDKNNPEADAIANYFRISDAVRLDGKPADLKFIDFIKVQTGVNAYAGQLGENSTEVFSFCDENNK